jgi:hypothetical protein
MCKMRELLFFVVISSFWWDYRQREKILISIAKVDVVPACESLRLPIFGMIVFKETSTLCIAASNLKHKLSTSVNDHASRPQLHVHRVDLSHSNFLDIGAEVVAVRAILDMLRVRRIDSSQRSTQPALDNRDRVTARAGIED